MNSIIHYESYHLRDMFLITGVRFILFAKMSWVCVTGVYFIKLHSVIPVPTEMLVMISVIESLLCIYLG